MLLMVASPWIAQDLDPRDHAARARTSAIWPMPFRLLGRALFLQHSRMPAEPAAPKARLAEMLGGLSLACDLADGFPPEKVLRTVVLAMELGTRAGLSAERLREVYYTTLLRYV